MKRMLVIALGAVVALAIVAAGVVWSWTRTPHGTLDVGAAIVVHSMPAGEEAGFSPENRARMDGWVGQFMPAPVAGVAIRDTAYPIESGEQPLRVYTPPGDGPFPLVVWIHGGGFFMGGDLPIWDGPCSQLAADVGAGTPTDNQSKRRASGSGTAVEPDLVRQLGRPLAELGDVVEWQGVGLQGAPALDQCRRLQLRAHRILVVDLCVDFLPLLGGQELHQPYGIGFVGGVPGQRHAGDVDVCAALGPVGEQKLDRSRPFLLLGRLRVRRPNWFRGKMF